MDTFIEFCEKRNIVNDHCNTKRQVIVHLTDAEKLYLKYLTIYHGSQSNALRMCLVDKKDDHFLSKLSQVIENK